MVLRHRFGFGIGDIDDVILVDVDSARAAELRPLIEQFAVLVENLDAVVLPVADEQPPLRIHRDRVGNVELAARGALFAPGLDELPLLGEFHDTRGAIAAVSVGDKDVAVRSDDDRGWCIELIRTTACDAGLAEPYQKLPFRTELQHLLAFATAANAVRHPDIAFTIDMKAVRENEQPLPEALH